jgi:hypothetical protein
MIVGASSLDFSEIIDVSPSTFGIFYWWSDDVSPTRNSATITKSQEGFIYEFHSTTGGNESVLYVNKSDLINRMQSDNLKYNNGGKCTIEF